jgi:hypothetical protein
MWKVKIWSSIDMAVVVVEETRFLAETRFPVVPQVANLMEQNPGCEPVNSTTYQDKK